MVAVKKKVIVDVEAGGALELNFVIDAGTKEEETDQILSEIAKQQLKFEKAYQEMARKQGFKVYDVPEFNVEKIYILGEDEELV
ncbi:MAG: hypothetical protein LPK26_04630 [Bacillaceae bacterium]|nr:hypothetical protein [Bacillaceae bacterium]